MTPNPVDPDPFRYGWRYVRRTLPDGRETLDQVPLTLEDVLHPEEEDATPEDTIHEPERSHLVGACRRRLWRLHNAT